MIVKNEEKALPVCLHSVKDICEEIIIVDTGSADDTIKKAQEFGAVIIPEPWKNDFSHARNISIRAAKHPWILWLDADDIVPADSELKIQEIKKNYSLNHAFGFLINNSSSALQAEMFQQIRMFPNRQEIFFESRIHEQVLPSIQSLNLPVCYTDIVITHTGYCSAEAKRTKQERNIILLEKELCETKPDNPVLLYLYAGALADLGRGEEAVPFYEKA
jgi:glycosyltransferase involved in cell wall biosynthesis